MTGPKVRLFVFLGGILAGILGGVVAGVLIISNADVAPASLTGQTTSTSLPEVVARSGENPIQTESETNRVENPPLSGNGQAHLWIQNRAHTWKNVVDGVSISDVTLTVTVSGFQPGESYAVQWWDPLSA
jgi:hypothetical protein